MNEQLYEVVFTEPLQTWGQQVVGSSGNFVLLVCASGDQKIEQYHLKSFNYGEKVDSI